MYQITSNVSDLRQHDTQEMTPPPTSMKQNFNHKQTNKQNKKKLGLTE